MRLWTYYDIAGVFRLSAPTFGRSTLTLTGKRFDVCRSNSRANATEPGAISEGWCLETNRVHLIKSLAYFVDAEGEPMPQMLVEVDWSQVKGFFTREAKRLFDTL